jgi:predicted dehydrogenase
MARIGMVGLGFMGRMHLAAYENIEDAQIVAVMDTDPKRASGDLSGGWGNIEGAAEQLDMADIRGTTNLDELLAMEDVEVVDICIPTPYHEEVVLAALASGKHVLCEKPLAPTAAAAEQIAAAAEKAQGIFMPAMCIRFWPQWAWLKRAVDDGRYGRVQDAMFRRLGALPPGWFGNGEMSGGALLDLHVHDSDFVQHLLGMPEGVFSRGYVGASGRTDHIVTQYLYGPDGPASVTAEGSWTRDEGFGFTMQYAVKFEKATVIHDIGAEQPLKVHQGAETEAVELEGDGYAAELAYFLECVREGKTPEIVTAADAVASLRLVEAEQQSIETGQIVTL